MDKAASFHLLKIIRKTNEFGIITLFSVIIVSVFLQVTARYVFNRPPDWTEELSRYCQVWMVILTSSVCIRKGSHLAVDYLTHNLTGFWKKSLNTISNSLITLYVAAVLYYGFALLQVGLYQYSPAMQIRMFYLYLVFPIGYSLMLIESIIATVQGIKE